MLRKNSEITTSTRRSSLFVPGLEFCVLAVGFLSFSSGCEDLVWEQAELVENSTGCPGFGMAPPLCRAAGVFA